ncbi:MAG: hypothetical protein IJ681_02695 [Bacteroidales bacterium]|nr:hypothetical protein [Bacteroidales bacterium]
MIHYVKQKRTLWVKGEKVERYNARILRSADTPLDTIAQEISHATSVSYPDVLAALKAFEIHVSNHVLNGSAVRFGTLGSFIPTLRTKAVTESKEVNADTVRRVTCRFFPSKDFRLKMKTAQLEFKDLDLIKHV